MDALCYEYMDRLILADDIPGSQTLSCLITSMSYNSSVITLTLSEPPDWSLITRESLSGIRTVTRLQ
jgi:hypothetical protein